MTVVRSAQNIGSYGGDRGGKEYRSSLAVAMDKEMAGVPNSDPKVYRSNIRGGPPAWAVRDRVQTSQ